MSSQISEKVDIRDASTRLVTVMGDPTAAAEDEPAWYLFLLRKELASAYDGITPGVWQTTSIKIDPEKVSAYVRRSSL